MVGAAGVEVGAGFGEREDDGFFDGAVSDFDMVGPISAKPGGFDFLVEFIAVELGGRAIRIEPKIELKIEIAIIVGAKL